MIKGTTYPIQNIYDNEFAAEGPVSTKIDIPVSKSTACVLKVNYSANEKPVIVNKKK